MSPRILVVDDEPSLLEGLTYALEREQFEVQVATDGRSALNAALTQSIDLVLLDLMLPEMSGEEVCREFRLGYAPGGARLASRAVQEGYTQEELLAVGLANRRGNDYFQRRIVFPLADVRGRVRGFQARKLHDDDPLQAKYVNSPEGELFRKGDLLYGLDTARQAIARFVQKEHESKK